MSSIVHLGKYYFPDTGGIESVTSSLAKGAVNAGHQVTVICFKKHPANDAEIIEGIQIYRAPIWKLIASQPLSWKYVVLCLQEARKADIVHIHTPNMIAAFCGLMIGNKSRILVHWHSDIIGKGLLGRIFKPLETALLKRADGIIVTSQIYANASLTLKPFYSKVSVVPIGVPDPGSIVGDESDIEDLSPELLAKLNSKRLILAVGRLVPYKGFNVLIDAAMHLRDDAIVFIVGGGLMQDRLQASIETAGVSDRVYLVGHLSDKALRALFKRATLYCLPSVERSEAFGVVLLEAMTYGLPIVATNIPGSGVPWVNQHDFSGINVTVGDPVELANACNTILSSPDVHSRLSTGARLRYLSEFTEGDFVTKTLDVYTKIS